MTAGSMADHWWWRPGWRPGRRMYAFHFTFGDQPAVCELAGRTAAAEVLLGTVRLIVLGRDHHQYEWTTRETIPLRGI